MDHAETQCCHNCDLYWIGSANCYLAAHIQSDSSYFALTLWHSFTMNHEIFHYISFIKAIIWNYWMSSSFVNYNKIQLCWEGLVIIYHIDFAIFFFICFPVLCSKTFGWHHLNITKSRLISPATRLFIQKLIQVANKTSKLCIIVPFVLGFCAQRVNNVMITCFQVMTSTWFMYSSGGSLTHWGQDKMDAISWTTFSNAFSWIKMFEYRLKFHWSLFLRVQLTISQHWFRKWLGADQATSHYLDQWWLDYRRIYASLGLNELMMLQTSCQNSRHIIYIVIYS